MYWFDVAIIYFALGAPFGVLRITAKREFTPFAYLRMTSGYLLWPLVAIRNVARFLAEARTSVRASTPNASTTHNASERRERHDLDAIRTELEQALFADGNSNDLYNFREVFYRYTGLAAAVNAQRTVQNSQSNGFNSPFSIQHSPLIRSACIARRDRRILESQLTQARREFNDLLASHPESDKLKDALSSDVHCAIHLLLRA